MRSLKGAWLATVILLLAHGQGLAKPGDLTLEVLGSARWPVIDRGTGLVHAFLCIGYELNSGIKEECYGFYPRKAQVSKIILKNGNVLSRTEGSSWVESPTNYRFTERSAATGQIELYDGTRDFLWQLSVPQGRSQWSQASTGWHRYLDVNGVEYLPATNAVIGGPGMVADEWNQNPTRFTNIVSSFKRVITIEQRRTILSRMQAWSDHHYQLMNNNCVDLVDDVAKSLKLKTPTRTETQSPVEYVSALATLNP